MSDTPVTDAAAFRSGMGHEYVEADVARGLELDRAALAAKCAQFHRAARMALDELEANRRGIAVTYATPTDDPAREIRRLLYGGRALEATAPSATAAGDKPSSQIPPTPTNVGRIPELHGAERNAAYWIDGAKGERNKVEALICLHQAVNAWKNAAYAAWDQIYAARSATPRTIKTMPLIKRLKDQRDTVAEVLREAFDARGCERKLADGSGILSAAWLERARAILAECPSYEQQLRNIAEGIGMTYEELIEALNAHRAEGRTA